MAYTIEKILTDARKLVCRLKDHDGTADSLIARTEMLHKQVEAMKQFQDNLNELNEIARHRPRASLIISLAQENSQIRELQQENKELKQSLEDHQSALELIMSKYREQVSKLVKTNQIERSIVQVTTDDSKELESKMDKIYEMAAVMWKAVTIDDHVSNRERQIIAQLQLENQAMRELLDISTSGSSHPPPTLDSKETQTLTDSDDDSFCSDMSTIRRRSPATKSAVAICNGDISIDTCLSTPPRTINLDITPSLATGVTPPHAVSVAPPLAANGTPPLAVSVTPPLAVSVTPPLAAGATPPLAAGVTPPLAANVTPPHTVNVAPPLATGATPPLATSATPPLAANGTPPLATGVTPPLVTSVRDNSVIAESIVSRNDDGNSPAGGTQVKLPSVGSTQNNLPDAPG